MPIIDVNNKDIATRIKDLLLEHTELRDNDLRLIANMWAQEVDVRSVLLRDFLRSFAGGGLTSPESIRRIRQKLQETMPELRGKRYEERQMKHEAAIRAEIKECVAVIAVKKEMRKQEATQVELIGG